MNTYEQEKQTFFKRHGGLKEVYTSEMVNDTYRKIYETEDGKYLHEVNRPIYEKVSVVVHGVTIETDVKLFCTEYWDTDNAKSRYHYEKY